MPRMPQMARPKTARTAALARWSPDGRIAAAIKEIVARAPQLDESQRAQLRAALMPSPVAETQ